MKFIVLNVIVALALNARSGYALRGRIEDSLDKHASALKTVLEGSPYTLEELLEEIDSPRKLDAYYRELPNDQEQTYRDAYLVTAGTREEPYIMYEIQKSDDDQPLYTSYQHRQGPEIGIRESYPSVTLGLEKLALLNRMKNEKMNQEGFPQVKYIQDEKELSVRNFLADRDAEKALVENLEGMKEIAAAEKPMVEEIWFDAKVQAAIEEAKKQPKAMQKQEVKKVGKEDSKMLKDIQSRVKDEAEERVGTKAVEKVAKVQKPTIETKKAVDYSQDEEFAREIEVKLEAAKEDIDVLERSFHILCKEKLPRGENLRKETPLSGELLQIRERMPRQGRNQRKEKPLPRKIQRKKTSPRERL